MSVHFTFLFFICLPNTPDWWLPSLSRHQNHLEGLNTHIAGPFPSFWFSECGVRLGNLHFEWVDAESLSWGPHFEKHYPTSSGNSQCRHLTISYRWTDPIQHLGQMLKLGPRGKLIQLFLSGMKQRVIDDILDKKIKIRKSSSELEKRAKPTRKDLKGLNVKYGI